MKSVEHLAVVTKPKATSYFRTEVFLRIINANQSFGIQDQRLYRKGAERRRGWPGLGTMPGSKLWLS